MAADKREYILDTAERLFAEQGYDAVSIREISRAADINIAMVSYYFGSKEKLYEEVVVRKLISSVQVHETMDKHALYKDKLFAVIDLYLNRFFENRQFQNIIFREMALNQRTIMAEQIASQVHRNFILMSEIIEKGIKHKEFKKVDIDLTLMSIIGIIRMYTTSGSMACKILQTDKMEDVFSEKSKNRLKKHLKELLVNHLGIE